MDLSIDYNKVCKDCKTNAHLRLDHSSGDLVCTRCGLVADEKAFDEGQDWRTFASEGVGSGNDGHAKQRADAMGAFDSMLQDGSGGTNISGGGAAALGLQKAQQMIKHVDTGSRAAKGSLDEKIEQERKIQGMTDTIRKAATRLTLGENIVQRCVMFLQDLAQKGHLTKQKKRPWLCALIHLASREEGATQTIREIAQANADYRKGAVAPGAKGVKKDLPGGEKIANSAALEGSINTEVRELTKQLGLAKAVAYAEFAGTVFEGAQLDPSDPRGFSCPQLAPSDPQCYGRTGHQVLNTLRQTTMKHLETEDQLLFDCCMLVAVAMFFRLNYFLVAWLKCRSGRAVMAPHTQLSDSSSRSAVQEV